MSIQFVLITDEPTRPHFGFNELLAILDDQGNDTQQRAYFVGIQIDHTGQEIGAHVSIRNGINTVVPWDHLKPVVH